MSVAASRSGAYRAARDRMTGAERIVLTTHVQPDGDGIGSEAALARFLRARGKSVTILNPHPTARRFRFLEPDPPIVAFEPAAAERALEEADLLVVLDISVPERLGRLEPLVERIGPDVVIIDHHTGPPRIAGVDVRDVEAAATAEIVYRLLVDWAADEITPEIATALYSAIAYDTGGFRYANTTGRTHEIAADLLRRGADTETANRWIFESLSLGRVRLTARVLSGFSLEADGRIAWARVSGSLLEETGASAEDVEGLVESLRAVEGVEVAILLKEVHDHASKVSLRSVPARDVQAFAAAFGGGGHRNASGIYMEEPLDDAVRRLVPAAVEWFGGGRDPKGG
ncbi:MAG TPA: DHH family phosphoesterase [Gemmatimonadota bacterium]|nr:DHH family phosphoesterase [Gemmatimonadota bacterium]